MTKAKAKKPSRKKVPVTESASFQAAKARAAVGHIASRPGGPSFTGTGKPGGFIALPSREPFKPSDEDLAATDWSAT